MSSAQVEIDIYEQSSRNGTGVREEIELSLIHKEPVRAAGPGAPSSSPLVSPPGPSSPPPSKPNVMHNLDAHRSLQGAKDRAQITASTSMSIVHVVFLNQLWKTDSEVGKSYYICLALVTTALALQIVTGLVALYVAFLRKYLRKYHDNFASDCCNNICPWSCKKKEKFSDRIIDDWIGEDSSCGEDKQPTPYTHSDCCCACFSWQCTNSHFNYDGYNILDIQMELQNRLLQVDIKTAGMDDRMKEAEDDVSRLKTDLQDYEASGNTDAQKLEQLRKKLKEAEGAVETLVREDREARVLHAKYKVLEQHVDAKQNEMVLKQAECWQNVVNIMLYAVFILNAFIAGLGLSGTSFHPDENNAP